MKQLEVKPSTECWAHSQCWGLLALWSWTLSWTHCKNVVKTVSLGLNHPISQVNNSLSVYKAQYQAGHQHFAFHSYYHHHCIIYTNRGRRCLDRYSAGSGKQTIFHNRQGLSQQPDPSLASTFPCTTHLHRKECSGDTQWPRISKCFGPSTLATDFDAAIHH